MSSAEKIRKLFAKSDVTVNSKIDDRIISDALTAFDKPEKTQSFSSEPNIWRIIMKSRITKLAAAAVIIISGVFLITFFDKAATPAYALEQTIEANHTIKTVHLRMFKRGQSIRNNEFSDYWLKYDDAGKLSNLRCNEHDKNGVVRFTVWNEGVSKTWIPENNVVIVKRLNNMADYTVKKWEDFAKECDPKLFLQRLYDLSKEEEAIELKIDEPAQDGAPIYVEAVNSVDKTRLEFVVDRKTKLIKKFSMYHLREHGDELSERIEFLAYNQPIDPSMFELRGIPDNAKVIDKLGDIIVGLRVGDFTFGMSKDEVLRKLGEPKKIHSGDESYTLNNLPRRYNMIFDDIAFEINNDSVKGIGVHSTLYKFTNGLGVGDSEQKIKQAFGGDFQLREGKRVDTLTYKDKGLTFEIHKKDRTVMEINVSQITTDHGDSDAPNSGKVIMFSEQPPKPITFPKIDRKPKPGMVVDKPREINTLPKYDPNSTSPFRIDLRRSDLSKLDLSNSIDELLYARFDDNTVWPRPVQMPEGFYPKKIMRLGENPGLGVRTLHKSGITGKGVGIAIIDQPLLTEHQEYADSLRLYEENNVKNSSVSEMHGSAVASIAVGKTVGVAPDADLYYIATLSWDCTRDDNPPLNFFYKAQSIRRLLEINRQLPADRKIRVISISTGWKPSHEGYDEITAACEEAKAAGIFVVACSLEQDHGFKFQGLGRHPLTDPDVFESYELGLWWAKEYYDGVRWRDSDRLLIPMDSRTTASPCGSDKYVFYRQGGWSWSVPYIAGIYALATQVEPTITPERFWSLAMKTGRTIELEHKGQKRSFGPIIDPVRLIRSISDDVGASQRVPSKNTIVPGLCVGDYTLGMSKDKVLKELGEPQAIQLGEDELIRREEEKYSLNNLPRKYIMSFGNISFWIFDDSVKVISVHSPLYKLSNGLGVGDSEQKIKQAFGEDFQPRESLGKDLLCYDAKGLGFEIHKKNQTVAEIVVYESSTVKPIQSIKPFDDVRSKDLSKLDLSSRKGLIATLAFDQQTVWPEQAKMPPGSDPKKILADGMNPGLGVRELHQQGITGKGVNVAIIDQPLLPDHPEYDGKIMAYHDMGCGPSRSSMHGPAVASLLVGTNCGTAPGAKVYYAAAPMWTGDTAYEAKALDWIVEQNKKLPVTQKIRVVSVSAAPSSPHKRDKNRHMWDPACARAEADGIMVLDGTRDREFLSCCWYDVRDPESVGKCNPGTPQRPGVDPTFIHVPASCRTTAKDAAGDCRDRYVYWGDGADSWTYPYCAGVLAMGWQIRPDLTPAQMKEMLFASAYMHKSGARIINPTAFIEMIRKN